MRVFIRSCAVWVLAISLCALPEMAATATPLGSIVQAYLGRVDGTEAVMGSAVYPGDALDTDDGGTLRLKIGPTQLYLMGSTAVTLGQSGETVQVNMTRGTMVFSSIALGQLEIETPVGTIRAVQGRPASGQVTLVDECEAIVSTTQETLVVERNREQHTIETGKSYDVIRKDGACGAALDRAGVVSAGTNHLVLKAIVVVTAGVAAYYIWDHAESPSSFKH
jgi:hypothetical protein